MLCYILWYLLGIIGVCAGVYARSYGTVYDLGVTPFLLSQWVGLALFGPIAFVVGVYELVVASTKRSRWVNYKVMFTIPAKRKAR